MFKNKFFFFNFLGFFVYVQIFKNLIFIKVQLYFNHFSTNKQGKFKQEANLFWECIPARMHSRECILLKIVCLVKY